MRKIARILIGIFLAGSSQAQERISPEAFLDRAVGQTLTFELLGTGIVVGREEFLNRRLSVWREEGDTCVYGRVTVEDGKLCFLYDDRLDEPPVCWWTFQHEGQLLVYFAGSGDTEIQEVTRIDKNGLNCPVKPGV